MFTCKVENAQGQSLVLTGDEPRWQIFRINGLNPPRAQVNLSEMAGLDGAWFNSSKLDTRNIVIYIKINGNAELNRITLYNYFRTKQKLTFYFSHSSRDVYIEGYCESVQVSPFDRSQVMQISILCPYPYFRSVGGDIVPYSNSLAMFEFPFSINGDDPIPFSETNEWDYVYVDNASDDDVGMKITIENNYANDGLKFANTSTGEYIQIDYSFQIGDLIQINTITGHKDAVLYRNGQTIKLFPYIAIGSTFLQLHPGVNVLKGYDKNYGSYGDIYMSDILQGRYTISFAFDDIFRGV